MRDINRIDKFCDELKDVWKQVPDWRFGQFIINFINDFYSKTGMDPFFPEDDVILNFLKNKFLNNTNKEE